MPLKTAPKRKTTSKNRTPGRKVDSPLGSTKLHRKLKLSQHRHTGHLLPAKHTSHGVLLVLMLLVGVMVLYTSKSYTANADALTGSGSLGLSGLVKPIQAAQINQPLNEQVFNTKEVNINGSCPVDPPQNIVSIIDNGIIAGSAPCSNGAYQLKIDLFPAINYLRASVSDIYGQAGPDSTVIKVSYIYPTNANAAFDISSESSSFGAVAGHAFSVTLTISGGKSPYAFNIDWGDDHSDVLSRADSSSFAATHIYKTGGEFTITTNASDSSGQKAFAQTTVLVSGPAVVAGPVGPHSSISGSQPYALSALKKLEPAYVAVTSIVFVFWLGSHLAQLRFLKPPKLPHFRI
jgi:hypothetical protein